MLRSHIRLLALACAVTATAASAGPESGSRDQTLQRASARSLDFEEARRDALTAQPSLRAMRRLKKLDVEGGDLLSASERQNSALRIRLDPEIPIKRARLKQSFVPRGVDYHPERGWMAVAAVSRVLIYDLLAGTLQIVMAPGEGAERFGFVNDVLFVGDELFIADLGTTIDAIDPADGAIWKLDLETLEVTEVGTTRDLVNPAFLALDPNGRVHVLDREAGALIVPVLTDRWDVIYRLAGKKKLRVVPVFTGTGIQATAYEIDASGRHWIANVTDIAILEGGALQTPCGTTFPFRFATAMTTGDEGAWVLDGANAKTTERRLFTVDSDCTATLLSEANKLRKSRGLVRVPAGTPDP